MPTTTPPSIIITTSPMVGKMGYVICGLVVAERVSQTKTSGKLDSEGRGEKALQDIRDQAKALGADAVVEVKINYENLGGVTAGVMVTVSGLAVRLVKMG